MGCGVLSEHDRRSGRAEPSNFRRLPHPLATLRSSRRRRQPQVPAYDTRVSCHTPSSAAEGSHCNGLVSEQAGFCKEHYTNLSNVLALSLPDPCLLSA